MLYVVCGPTCSFKNQVVFDLCKQKPFPIINTDPFQIYKEIPIITNQPINENNSKIEMYFYGNETIKTAKTQNVFLFREKIRKQIFELEKEHKNIFLIGGSGFYLSAILNNYLFKTSKSKQTVKDTATNSYENKINKESLEPLFEYKTFYLNVEKSFQNKLIKYRTDQMFSMGLVNEIKKYFVNNSNEALEKLVGVTPIIKLISGSITINEAKEKINLQTKQLVKKQKTWFRHKLRIDYSFLIKEKSDVSKTFLLIKNLVN